MKNVNQAFTIFQQKKQGCYFKSIFDNQEKLAGNALVCFNFYILIFFPVNIYSSILPGQDLLW